jgi:hypothetical protein
VNNKDHITLSGLTCLRALLDCIFVHDGDPDSIIVEDCIARYSGDLGMLFRGCHNVTVRRCEASYNTWNGIAFQTATATSAVGPILCEYNLSHHNLHTGFDFQAAINTQDISGITFRYNKGCYNGHQGAYFDQEDGRTLTNVEVAYSLFHQNGRVGLYFDDNSGSSRTTPYAANITISNCTMSENGIDSTVTGPGIVGFMQNAVITNCIISDNQTNRATKTEILINDGGGTQNTLDYCDIYNATATNTISWDGGTYSQTTFAAAGQNTHGIVAAPGFLNANCSLVPTSACRDMGTVLAYGTDLAGIAVPYGTACDLGCFEFGLRYRTQRIQVRDGERIPAIFDGTLIPWRK